MNVAPLIRAVLSTLRRAAAPKPEWDVVRCDAGWRLEQQVFELGELDWREVACSQLFPKNRLKENAASAHPERPILSGP